MSGKIFLNLGVGNLSAGFAQISSRLEIDGKLVAQKYASLPGNSALQDLHYRWQFYYAAYYENYPNPMRGENLEIELDPTGITGFSVSTFQETRINLERDMRQWLDTPCFEAISLDLQDKLDPNRETIVIIETEEDTIHRLPWHCWSLLENFPRAEIAFSLNTYQQQTSTSHRTKPRILAILGDRIGIDTAAEIQAIQQLQADVRFSIEPSIAEIIHKLNDRQGWDLLFFAGHSSYDRAGTIKLNGDELVCLTTLSHALESAISRGLKLAIFNSCSGLGLATSLATLNIPTVIVMREAIPNRVAQDFLRAFLSSFAGGNSLLSAVGDGRAKLQQIEADFPCATWLPVVFCNPSVDLPTWKSFYPQSSPEIKLWQLAAIALAATATIWGIRSQGYLEPIELATYDVAMVTRAIPESPDGRILIVGVTETDLQKWGSKNSLSPLKDRILAQTLQKLQQSQPKAIGLDIYRDRPIGGGHADLAPLLQQDRNPIVSSCLMPGTTPDFPGVAAPTGVKSAQVGFTNFSPDRDGIIRRQMLGMAPVDKHCDTDTALSLRLALKYLGIAEAQATDDENIEIGSREVEVLKSTVGGYRSNNAQNNLRGFQVMFNYRNTPNIATQVSLDDILTDRVSSTDISGKVILIGYVAPTMKDFLPTGAGDMAGVKIHAHMTSNILSHILDDRPLITTLPDPIEMGWIFIWGVVGGSIVLRLRGVKLCLVGSATIVALVGSCVVCFHVRSIWMPLVPAGLTLVLTPLAVKGFCIYKQPIPKNGTSF
jgi:CHASE2 domain-containing sensor protein